eukprot:3182617-Rhodomonas_salina.2
MPAPMLLLARFRVVSALLYRERVDHQKTSKELSHLQMVLHSELCCPDCGSSTDGPVASGSVVQVAADNQSGPPTKRRRGVGSCSRPPTSVMVEGLPSRAISLQVSPGRQARSPAWTAGCCGASELHLRAGQLRTAVARKGGSWKAERDFQHAWQRQVHVQAVVSVCLPSWNAVKGLLGLSSVQGPPPAMSLQTVPFDGLARDEKLFELSDSSFLLALRVGGRSGTNVIYRLSLACGPWMLQRSRTPLGMALLCLSVCLVGLRSFQEVLWSVKGGLSVLLQGGDMSELWRATRTCALPYVLLGVQLLWPIFTGRQLDTLLECAAMQWE